MIDQSMPSQKTPKRSNPLSKEEYHYVIDIRMTVGCVTPILNGEDPKNSEGVKAILTEAQEKGLDPQRIYQSAVGPNSVITRRIPAWEKVKPNQEPATA
jgi:hypothetical protein